ncbi:MAG TPA: SCE4755 family polysaccharide monooxygenase-like protein [Kofleriaceae bacterium]|jgi:hypothetical protein
MRLLKSVLIVGALSTPAFAHFVLVQPWNFATQDISGDPQKTAPCGPSGAFTASNAVTEYQTGSMIDITINETVTHPGHYRVSLAQNVADLPSDPPVNNPGVCGSLDINPSPALPLLADGLLVHTSGFGAPQTVQVQLPPGMTCTNCVLQVQEFMAQHGAPCFYHHCAMVTIKDAPLADPPHDGGMGSAATPDGANGDAGSSGPATGGGCSTGSGTGLAMGLAGLGLRRRRTPR